MCGLSFGIFSSGAILKVKVRFTHISTVNIIKWWQITKKLIYPSYCKSCMGFRLACVHLTLNHFKDEGQSHAHFFTANILEMVTDRKTLLLLLNIKPRTDFIFGIYTIPLTNSKGQVHAHFDCKYHGNGERYAKITVAIKYEDACSYVRLAH